MITVITNGAEFLVSKQGGQTPCYATVLRQLANHYDLFEVIILTEKFLKKIYWLQKIGILPISKILVCFVKLIFSWLIIQVKAAASFQSVAVALSITQARLHVLAA